MIIIDNLVQSFANDIENGLPIKPYIKGKEDYEQIGRASCRERC